jgi:predicted XRE-type DNA-binding protein
MTNEGPDHEISSGNVFADLGLPDSDELLAKAALVHQLIRIASHRHLTQAQVAGVLGTTQPKVSELFAGKLAGFSMERLMRFLNAFDRDVRIVVSPKPRGRSKATVSVVDSPVAARRTRAVKG